jgi:hypothetical protein
VLASLCNFPFWWVGLTLGVVADRWGPRAMLLTESALGIVGLLVFFGVDLVVKRSSLPA